MKYASLCVNHSHNIGDIVQQIAVEQFLPQLDLEIDRDSGLDKNPNPQDKQDKQVAVVLNGWFKYKLGSIGFPPHPSIYPIFFGFHVNLRKCPELVGPKAIQYYKNHKDPIVCRDQYTQQQLRKHGVTVHPDVFCLTLTFPRRTNPPKNGKILISSLNKKILNYLPPTIRKKGQYFNHFMERNLKSSQKKKLAHKLIHKYRDEAKLVITTYLHAALPCIAMGIPTIMFYPIKSEIHQEDKARLSLARQFIPVYTVKDIAKNRVNWNPPPPDIEIIKAEKIQLLKSLIPN